MNLSIPLSRPDVTDLERRRVLEVLQTPYLSMGPVLGEFEARFASYIGARHAVAVNSGTSGLHVCVRGSGLGEGDEVITTPFSFVASANCLLFEKVRPVFVDIDERTYNIDTNRLAEVIKKRGRRGKRLKAVLPVHVFGRPCDMADILRIASEHGMGIIEDACEAVGAEVEVKKSRGIKVPGWKKVGTLGDCGVFAFYPNKQMTTGEGGMIVTDDRRLADHCRSLRNQGRARAGAWLQHERLGYNYRLSDINCALGLAQLERLEKILEKRERVASLYAERLQEVPEVIPPPLESGKRISWFVYVVRLAGRFRRSERDVILRRLRAAGIGCSDYFSPIHLQPFYRRAFGYKKGDFPVTEAAAERTIALPFHNNLTADEVETVVRTLKKILPGIKG